MRLRFLPLIAALLCAGHVAFAPVALASPSKSVAVEIPRAGGVLRAQLYKPDGDGPFPTVIALHGCAGLTGNAAPVRPRYADWAEQLLKTGHAVLLPDSYGSRELGPQCRAKTRRMTTRRERLADISTARHWLAEQSWVARQRIGLIGWDTGASALLWAVRPQSALARGEPEFRSAVAFYPDCRSSARLGWSARVPTLVLIGGDDDITSASACRAMVDGAQGRSALTRLVVYPGAYHDFDRAEIKLHLTSVADPEAAEPGHLGFDAAARADAERRVAHWLGR
ncbi:dienelactone hydrolase family protein [Rhodopseudomonas sp. HC1]|uniref:dienelactone hydrolase family protein n=1 Tax=Rhodopseudomonas infernalis TaxID=2897386 RepID=UPI001EE96C3D|nr:dienelactone hydrolase family protein [Rhodopseudomonas infernalis]MCG6207398.1 dienelactone hydrolase family protein [Rhodopseudomonas infernalis]